MNIETRDQFQNPQTSENPPKPKNAEDTEGNTKPENQKNQGYETASKKARAEEVIATTQKLNLKLVLDLLRLSIDEKGDEDKEISELINEHLANHNEEGLEIDQESIQGLKKLLFELPKRIKSEVDLPAEKRNEIVEHICAPVLYGHLSAEDILTLVDTINISSNNQDTNSQGYEAYMSYSSINRSITIDAEIIDGYINTTNEKGEGEKTQLDIEHMITHELSHGVTEYLISKAKSSSEKNESILKKANEIIEKAEEFRGSQTFHIENVLESISEQKIQSDFEEAQGEHPDISFDEFRQNRIQLAAKEIITDYTALFLQSNGDFLDFTKVCLEKTDTNKLMEFLSKDLAEDEDLYEAIKSIIAPDGEINKDMLEDKPKLKLLISNYLHFFDLIKNNLTKNEIFNNFEQQMSDDDYDDEVPHGRGFDSFNNFTHQTNNAPKDEGLTDSIKALASAFADEVDILPK